MKHLAMKSAPIDTSLHILLEDVQVCRHENQLLQNVNMHLAPGEFAYLTGPVGAGKSSLLELLYGELAHKEGTAIVLGYNLKNIKRSKRQELRRRMGIVFQSSAQLLYDRNVEANLDFVLRATTKLSHNERLQKVQEALNKVGMPGKGYKMPHELSGGEAERICIARTIIMKPSLILMDEPTAGLDQETALSIGKLVKSIAEEGASVLMATHNTELMKALPAPTYCINSESRTLSLEYPNTDL